jgi:type IV secretory pathway VirB9-like protein
MRLHHLSLAALFVLTGTVGLTAQSFGVREVTVSDRSVVSLTTRLRYTTMIQLPDEEEILDVVCGDRDFWVISATQHVAHVKPAKEGASTNLHLVTASGRVYSFLLTEQKTGEHDLKVYVTADAAMAATPKRFYSAADLEATRAEVADARAAAEAAKRAADESLARYRRGYPARLQFVYKPLKYERPFFVRSIWHDGEFTYLRTDARELPALYELQDGAPALLNFRVEHGLYVVPKVLERGYLAIGKARLDVQQER